MKRVVVTGMGIWSCIGQDLQTVTESLRQGRSGIIFDQERLKHGLHSGLVGNVPMPDLKPYLSRQARATMSKEAKYAYMAACQAFEQAGITEEYIRLNEVGIIFGSDGNAEGVDGLKIFREEKDTWVLDPGSFFKEATSSASMNLATHLRLKGLNININAGCASAAHAIGIATIYIKSGCQDVMLVGGATGDDVYMAASFDAINALSLRNNEPSTASRPFDKERDGAITSAGAAALILEDYEHAIARGATIFAEVAGYGFSSNNNGNISTPDSEMTIKSIKNALLNANLNIEDIDYINSCASSAIIDDVIEAEALVKICNSHNIPISSTESMTGHEGWMGGASAAIYSILMMQEGFIAPNINLNNKMEEAKELNIITQTIYQPVNTVLLDSNGLGGTSSALVFRKI